MHKYHPFFLDIPSEVYPCAPKQAPHKTFGVYSKNFLYYWQQQALIQDWNIDLGNYHTQDTFILGMDNSISKKVSDIVKVERDAPNSVKKIFYQAGNFLTSIGQIVDEHQLEPVLRSRLIALRNRKKSSTNSILSYTEDEKNFTDQGLFALAYDGVHEDDCLDSDD